MRALHLYFRLHCPYRLKAPRADDAKLNYFDGEAEFREADRTEYQPFFALLERNAQKYPNLKLSVSVSGPWIEQAQRFDPELIERLHKLANLGCVQLLVQPYYYSLANFYNIDEFAHQVSLHQQKLDQLFGSQTPILALPELIYNDHIAKWAENAGFQGALTGAMEKPLAWRSANQVFEAAGRDNFRLLCQNTRLSHAIMHGRDEAVIEETAKNSPEQPRQPLPENRTADFSASAQTTGPASTKEPTPTKKLTFSAQKFQKYLELESLRGGLINLCLGTEIFRTWREAGIVRFFDELIAIWAKTPRHLLLNASDALESMTPTLSISTKVTVNWRTAEYDRTSQSPTAHSRTSSSSIECNQPPKGLIKLDQIQNRPPRYLDQKPQTKSSENLYNLRDLVLRTKDDNLYATFGKLTTLDYMLAMNPYAPELTQDAPNVRNAQNTQKTQEIQENQSDQPEQTKQLFADILENFTAQVLAKQPQPAKLSATAQPRPQNAENHSSNSSRRHAATRNETNSQSLDNFASEPDDEAPESEENDFSVPIFRVTKVHAQKPTQQEVQDAADEVQILAQRLAKKKKLTEVELSELTEAEVVTPKKPKRSGRRFMKKLVIE